MDEFSYFKKLVGKVLDVLITWGKLFYYVYLCVYIYIQFEKQDLYIYIVNLKNKI